LICRANGKLLKSPPPENTKFPTLWRKSKTKKTKKKHGRKAQRSRIPDRVSIHSRPTEIENRAVFGHWEGDSVEGRAHQGGIHTEVERKTRFIMAKFVKDLTAQETADKASQNVSPPARSC